MKTKESAKRILAAARRGHLELEPGEEYLVEKKEPKKGKKTAKKTDLDDRLATKGFSLIEQVRAEKPIDLMKKNLKYIKYTDSRPLDPKKTEIMLKYHQKRLPSKAIIRQHRETITGLREPKKIIKKSRSVFSDKDFKNIGTKKLKKIQDEDGRFV